MISGSIRDAAAVAVADRVAVGLLPLELAVLVEPRDHALGRLFLAQPGEARHLVVHAPVEPDHGQLREVVVAADLEVERIVARGDLERPGTEAGLHPLVGDDRHAALDNGDDGLLADDGCIALVAGVDGDSDVGENRRRPHGRDRDVTRAVRERVADVVERVVDVRVVDLEIRDRAAAAWAPVDDAAGAVDPAAPVEMHEEAQTRPGRSPRPS